MVRKTIFLFISILFLFNGIIVGQTFSSVKPVKIPNNLTCVGISIPVSGLPGQINENFGLESVTLSLTHPADNTVEIYLYSPDGTQVPLSIKNGGVKGNYKNTVFNMNAPVSIMKGEAPFTGTFRPQGDLAAFNNRQDPNKPWLLIVIDILHDKDSGMVNNVALNFGVQTPKPLQFSSNLPIVVINTNGKYIQDEPRSTVDLSVISSGKNKKNEYNGKPAFKCKADVEIRGSSSQQFPKKSYSVILKDAKGHNLDTSLVGLPAEHNWILSAAYCDKTLIRNAIAYQLFSEMGHYSARFKFVELVIDRQYQGIYMLVEKIKRNKHRVNIAKLSRKDTSGTALSGGYIFKIDRVNKPSDKGWQSKYASIDQHVFFQYEYPPADSLTLKQQSYIQSFVDSFELALKSPWYADPEKGYRKYIDVSSFVDNFLLNELSKNVDGLRLSSFFYKNKADKDGRIVNGPVWDFDLAWANATENGASDSMNWQYTQLSEKYQTPFWWGQMMKDTTFKNEIYCRYNKFRQGCLSEKRINFLIDSLATLLREASERNFTQWPILGTKVFYEPTPICKTYVEEIDHLKHFIKARMVWMDVSIKGKCTLKHDIKNEEPRNKIKHFTSPFVTNLYINYQLDKGFIKSFPGQKIDKISRVPFDPKFSIHDSIDVASLSRIRLLTK